MRLRPFVVERGLGDDLGQVGIVDLQQEPGVDDRLVLGAHRLADGVEELGLALEVVVVADAARRRGRDERACHLDGTERRLEVLDIALQRRSPTYVIGPVANIGCVLAIAPPVIARAM